MGHSVQLIVGQGEAIAAFLRQWPMAHAVDLLGGWQAIPVDLSLHEAIEAKFPGAERPPELDVSPFGIDQALAAATEAGGGLAYVETEYFGGTGGQSAMAFVAGREAMAPQRARGGGGAINQALRAIGVVRTEADDEFDAIGLGQRRRMDDYDASGAAPARVEPLDGEAPAADDKAYVPMWKVALAIGAMVAVGLLVSVAF